ncbi:MAG: sulfatase [Planctomycetaceae bacterium]|nr:sulfatase [Planctomycetaceae bacterium]
MPRTFLICLLLVVSKISVAAELTAPNVLFIAVDDLRPMLHCYGEEHMVTPNIDKLANSSTLFERAYCMVPTCGASRASMMSGVRPAYNRFVNYLTRVSEDSPDTKTINTHFKQNGYTTLSNGKIFHHPDDQAHGWSKPAWRPKGVPTYRHPESLRIVEERKKIKGRRNRGPAYESADVDDEAYADGLVAKKTINDLRRLKTEGRPFFLACGFFKPHLPFVAPKKYWDLYDFEKIQLPETYHVPENAPAVSIHNSGELRAYAGIPAKGPVGDLTARKLIHGYYACVSYTDAQIGRVLEELERLELADETIVVLWSDHGWNLGEHTLWCKHSCYETSMHIPLLIRVPGVTDGDRTDALVESIDLYPTLAELANLERPKHLAGRSLVPLLTEPQQTWKPFAIGRYRQGDTLRTVDYRYSEYTQPNGKTLGRMLYDHRTDPEEDKNIVDVNALSAEVERLGALLNKEKGKPNPPKKKPAAK